MVTSLTLDALQDLVFCPMRYWWRQVAHLQEPETLDQVAQTILREAILECARIYGMETKPEPTIVHQAIQDNPKDYHLQVMVATLWGYRFIDWKQAELGRLLRKYGRADAEIVVDFVRGEKQYRRLDGSPYEAPRLTKVYQKLAREAGLWEVKQRIDKAADHLPIKPRKRQSLADTYAQVNGEMVADLVAGLPDWKGKVLRVDVPLVTVANDLELAGRADLLVQVEAQACTGASGDPLLAKVLALYAANFGRPAPLMSRKIREAVVERPDPEGWEIAFSYTCEPGVSKPWGYMLEVLSERRRHGSDGTQGDEDGNQPMSAVGPAVDHRPPPVASPPHPAPEHARVWQVVPDELELQMTKDAFDTWLADAQAEGIDGDTLIVGVPSVYAKDWLEGRLGTVVARTVHSVTEHIESVRFVLAGETGSGA